MTTAVTKLVGEGNEAISRKDYSTASYKYTQAINKTRTKPDHIIYVNRSCAYSAQSRYKEALVDANVAIKIKPSDYLGWIGKGRALFGLTYLETARGAFEKALKLNPQSENIQAWINAVREAIDSGRDGEFLDGLQILTLPDEPQGGGEEEEEEGGERPTKKVKREGPDTTTSIDTTHSPEPETGVVFRFILEQSRALCSFPMSECSTSAALFTKFRMFFELLNKDTVVSVLSCRLGSQDERHYLFEGSEGQFALLLRDTKSFKGGLMIEVRRVA